MSLQAIALDADRGLVLTIDEAELTAVPAGALSATELAQVRAIAPDALPGYRTAEAVRDAAQSAAWRAQFLDISTRG